MTENTLYKKHHWFSHGGLGPYLETSQLEAFLVILIRSDGAYKVFPIHDEYTAINRATGFHMICKIFNESDFYDVYICSPNKPRKLGERPGFRYLHETMSTMARKLALGVHTQ